MVMLSACTLDWIAICQRSYSAFFQALQCLTQQRTDSSVCCLLQELLDQEYESRKSVLLRDQHALAEQQAALKRGGAEAEAVAALLIKELHEQGAVSDHHFSCTHGTCCTPVIH